MKSIKLYEELTSAKFEKVYKDVVESRIKQLTALAGLYGQGLYKVSIADSMCPTVHYFIGYSESDFSDQSEFYNEMYIEDEEGFTLRDRCFVSFEEVTE